MRPEDLAAHWEAVMDMDVVRVALLDVEDQYPDVRSVVIPYSDVDRYEPDFAADLLDHPDESLSAARAVLARRTNHEDVDVRITDLPNDAAVEISKLRSAHINRLISVNGLLNRATAVRPEMRVAAFKCMRCPAVITEPQDSAILREPYECYKDQEGCGRTSGSTKFKLIPERCVHTDYQKVELQENPETLRGGSQPGRLTALLSRELTGVLQSGMRCTLNGILRTRMDKGKEVVNDLELEVISYRIDEGGVEDLRLTEDDMERIEAMSKDPALLPNIVRSVAPGLRGYEQEKLALSLQQVGGVTGQLEDGQKMRGDIHILLIGDAATGKSQLLRYMAGLSPRGIYVSGKSSSAAGLTAAAVKDEFSEGRWVLEAGALVLADRGLAAVDELNQMRAEDKSSMLEAMESQRVSVAKAGITASLQCRTSVLGGANPKLGRFDDAEALAPQIDLEAPFLSRFDLIFALLDKPKPDRDRAIAEHICRGRARSSALKHPQDPMAETILMSTADLRPVYDREILRKYLWYARAQSPILTEEARKSIIDHYLSVRALAGGPDRSVPITNRQLEAGIRLSEAAAKLRLSPYVEPQDALVAVKLMEHYLRRFGLDEDGNPDLDRINTGLGSKARNRLLTVDALLQDRKGRFSEAEFIKEAVGKGLEERKVRDILESMKKKGELLEPTIGELQVI